MKYWWLKYEVSAEMVWEKNENGSDECWDELTSRLQWKKCGV